MPRDGSVHVLNLVEGEEARITSPTGSFQPFTVHYAQTFILPEGAGDYRVGSPQGAPIRVILAGCGDEPSFRGPRRNLGLTAYPKSM